MGRGQNRSAGYNHVLAALADAIHAGSSYKGKGKGKENTSKGQNGQGGQWGGQDGRNCPNCNDYNFGFRTTCRQCGAWLPPPRVAGAAEKGQKATGKPYGTSGGWGSGGKGPAMDNGGNAGAGTSSAGGATPAAAAPKAPAGPENDEAQDPADRVRDIRSEEEKLRRSRSQYADVNPRLVSAIDEELAKLAAEREKLLPLEINLQAAAGRTANARAALAKAKEKRVLAAKELRDYMDRYKTADKEVADAEARLSAAEAAATAKRADAKTPTVQEAMEVLHQTAASKCGDATVAAQVSAALQQIASILGALTAPTATAAEGTGDGDGSTAGERPSGADGGTVDGGGTKEKGKGRAHPVFAACGATENKSRRTMASVQSPAAHAGPTDGGERMHGTPPAASEGQPELYAGGAVPGEVTMETGGGDAETSVALLSQAAALLEDADGSDL